jgi:hypothetical protein
MVEEATAATHGAFGLYALAVMLTATMAQMAVARDNSSLSVSATASVTHSHLPWNRTHPNQTLNWTRTRHANERSQTHTWRFVDAARGDDEPPEHLRDGFINAAVVSSLLASVLGSDAGPLLTTARILSTDVAIRFHLLLGCRANGTNGACRHRLPWWWLGDLPAIVATTSYGAPAAAANAAMLCVVISAAGMLTATIVRCARGRPATTSFNHLPRCLTVWLVFRHFARWQAASAALSAMCLWGLGPAAVSALIELGCIRNTVLSPHCDGSATTYSIAVAALLLAAVPLLVSLWVGVPVCRGPMQRAVFVAAIVEDPVAASAGFIRRSLFLTRGRWQAASTWDADCLAAVAPLHQPYVRRRSLYAFVEVACCVCTAAAVAICADGSAMELATVWAAAVNALVGGTATLARPFVCPWEHVTRFASCAALAVALRQVGASPAGASHALSDADLSTSIACVAVSLEATCRLLLSAWTRFHRRPTALALDSLAFGRQVAAVPSKLSVLRRATAAPRLLEQPLLLLPPEDAVDVVRGEEDVETGSAARDVHDVIYVERQYGRTLREPLGPRCFDASGAAAAEAWDDDGDVEMRFAATDALLAGYVSRAAERRNPLTRPELEPLESFAIVDGAAADVV